MHTSKMPEMLLPYYDPVVHEAYQVDTAESIHKRMGAVGLTKSEGVASHALIPPHLHDSEQVDPTVAIVMPYPFAIGLNDSMFTRSEYMANTMLSGMNTLAFTSRAIGSRAVGLTFNQRRAMASGNLTPLLDSQCKAIEQRGIEEVHFFTYSQGVTTGLPLAAKLQKNGLAEVKTILAIEAPNSQERTMIELAKNFSDTSLAQLNKAIGDTHIPAYIALSKAGGGLRNAIAQNASLARYAAGAVLPPNIAMVRNMQRNTLAQQLNAVLQVPETDVHHMRMQNSTILGEEQFDAINQQIVATRNFEASTIPGYGHEAGDQIVLMAALAHRAIASRL